MNKEQAKLQIDSLVRSFGFKMSDVFDVIDAIDFDTKKPESDLALLCNGLGSLLHQIGRDDVSDISCQLQIIARAIQAETLRAVRGILSHDVSTHSVECLDAKIRELEGK